MVIIWPVSTPMRRSLAQSCHRCRTCSSGTSRPGVWGFWRARKSSSARYTLPMPATTFWSMSSRPIGVGFRRMAWVYRSSAALPASMSGSGPSFATTASTWAGSSTSHAVGPRRSAQIVSVSSRTRTWPTGSGGNVSSSLPAFSDSDMRRRALRGAPIEVSEFSPAVSSTTASGFGPSRNVPRWLVWPMRPFAEAIVASIRISPAKSHAPYMPRCTRSHTSPSKPRNICLPTARASVIRRPSISAAPTANRPCGLQACTTCPTKLRSNWRVMRWTEWPSGIALLGLGPIGVDALAGDVARGLVLGELRDAPGVTLVTRERLGDERVDVADRLLHGVLPGADRDDVRIVVLACEHRGVHAPDEGGPDAPHLVRGDLLAVARSAEHDAECSDARGPVARDPECRVDAERRVVVERVIVFRAVVDDLMTGVGQVVDERA